MAAVLAGTPVIACAQGSVPQLNAKPVHMASFATSSIPSTQNTKPLASRTPVPRVHPKSKYLNDADYKQLKAGIRSARRGHWAGVERAHKAVSDPIAKDLLRWARVERQRNVPFDQLTYVAQQLPDWPRRTKIMTKAEKRLFDKPIGPNETINWFWGKEPVSGEGRAALARAHYATGNNSSGDMWLRLAWRESKLTRGRQQKLFSEFKTKLRPEDHYARADHLMWHGPAYYGSAQALLPYMSQDQKALINARLKLATNGSDINKAIKAVPAKLTGDAGLMYERAKWRKKHQSRSAGIAMYVTMKSTPQSDHGKKIVWNTKSDLVYRAIRQKKFNDAYKMCLNHGMTSGSDFAEAEFLAGWLALTKLGQADKAAKHFETLSTGVTYPVSLSRARYWQGRAAERTGDPNAQAYYSDAARFQNTYYGQLANENLESKFSVVTLPAQADSKPLRPFFEATSIIRALHLLGEVGDETWFNHFVYHLDDHVQDINELALLSDISREYGYMKPSIRAAKQASRFQTMLTESGYPVITAINDLPDKFDKAFVFAIARQESEFNYKAVSHANAYGLMQMIDSTASITAKRHRIPYSKAKMTKDINYSANLGAHHLNDLLKQFDGSYIMAAAAYNAGAGRVRTWNRQFGDPRKGEIDPIDWIESIPFDETRNYVQRVMENVQVYRARLNNNQTTSRIYQDLHHGAF